MGYTGAIRAMVLNEVVFLNEQSESWMDTIVTNLGKLERDVEWGHTWFRDCAKAMRQMEVDIGGLMAQQAFMRGSMDRMRGEMDTLLHLNGELVSVTTWSPFRSKFHKLLMNSTT